MNSLRRLCVPLLGALVPFLMVACISSAATITLQDLGRNATGLTLSLNEGNFDHDLGNPLVITILGVTWGDNTSGFNPGRQAGDPGDFPIFDSGGHLSDLIRFVNVNGVATIYFGSDNAGVSPNTGLLGGPIRGGTLREESRAPFDFFGTETTTISSFQISAPFFEGIIGRGLRIQAIIRSDSNEHGSISDSISLGVVPEPSTLTLVGLGALGLLIKSFRRRS